MTSQQISVSFRHIKRGVRFEANWWIFCMVTATLTKAKNVPFQVCCAAARQLHSKANLLSRKTGILDQWDSNSYNLEKLELWSWIMIIWLFLISMFFKLSPDFNIIIKNWCRPRKMRGGKTPVQSCLRTTNFGFFPTPKLCTCTCSFSNTWYANVFVFWGGFFSISTNKQVGKWKLEMD